MAGHNTPMDPSTCQRLSCGVVILNEQRELLLCHVTGHGHWDLPKGCIDAGESPLQAALRETWEETGLRLHEAQLVDLGRFEYRAQKPLHLFATLMPRLDLSQLSCSSHFTDRSTGQRLPEMDDYRWQPIDEVAPLCTPNMASVLIGVLDMARLLDRLSAMRPLELAA